MLAKIKAITKKCEDGKISERDLCFDLEMAIWHGKFMLLNQEKSKEIKSILYEKFKENKDLISLTNKLKIPYCLEYYDEHNENIDVYECHINFGDFRIIFFEKRQFDSENSQFHLEKNIKYTLNNDDYNHKIDDEYDYHVEYNCDYKDKEITYKEFIDKYGIDGIDEYLECIKNIPGLPDPHKNYNEGYGEGYDEGGYSVEEPGCSHGEQAIAHATGGEYHEKDVIAVKQSGT